VAGSGSAEGSVVMLEHRTSTLLQDFELTPPAVRLFVGGNAGSFTARNGGREYDNLSGARMFTAAHKPYAFVGDTASMDGIIDSGAFTDPPHKRLSPATALDRQMRWEHTARTLWGSDWQAFGIVSYDRLIDEKWIAGEKRKQRWSVCDGDSAVSETIEAARYIASQRKEIAPRKLILSCQGVDAIQYQECVFEVLKVAQPSDWIGLGGWCIIGQQRAWMPTFWQTMYIVLPMIAAQRIMHVHIFGVLYEPALAGLLWLTDSHGLRLSTDSTGPIMATTWKDGSHSNFRLPYWKDNAQWWVDKLANLRLSAYYKQPPQLAPARQESFL
jgi:hypothetical protein